MVRVSDTQVCKTKGTPMRHIVVIPCGGAKLTHPAPAAELYTGSMFQDALRTARMLTSDSDIFILSARYGLVTLDQILEPYDIKMGDAGSIHVDDVRLQADWYNIDDPYVSALLPKSYFKMLDNSLAFPYKLANMYAGCAGIGHQKHVLAELRKGCMA